MPESATKRPAQPPRQGPPFLLKRLALGAMTAVLSVNVWTGFPILALWLGSRFAFGDNLSMGGILMALLALTVLMFVGLHGLAWLSARYDQLVGRPPARRRPAPWLTSMRGEREPLPREGGDMNAIETIVVGTVVAGVVAFEIWFFLLAHFSLPQ